MFLNRMYEGSRGGLAGHMFTLIQEMCTESDKNYDLVQDFAFPRKRK